MRMKLLIVDDEKKIVRFLTNVINWQNFGFNEITSFTSSKEALLRLESGYVPDLLITDIRMPEVTGIDLVQKVNGVSKAIIISGYSDFEYAQKAIRYGVSDYLLKPIFPDELEQTITKIIKDLSVEKIVDNVSMENLYLALLIGRIEDDKHCFEIFNKLLKRHYVPGVIEYGATPILPFTWQKKVYGFFKNEKGNKLSIQRIQSDFFAQIYQQTVPESLIEVERFHKDIVANNWEDLTKILNEMKENNGQNILTKLRLVYLIVECQPELLQGRTLSELLALGLDDQLKDMLYVNNNKGNQKIEDSNQVVLIVEEYIRQNIGETLSIDILAEIVHMHPVYLSRVYKQETGKNLSHYILEQRLLKMRDLLVTTNLQVKTITELVGYRKPQNIIEAFKKKYGYTPTQYRKMLRERI